MFSLNQEVLLRSNIFYRGNNRASNQNNSKQLNTDVHATYITQKSSDRIYKLPQQ